MHIDTLAQIHTHTHTHTHSLTHKRQFMCAPISNQAMFPQLIIAVVLMHSEALCQQEGGD